MGCSYVALKGRPIPFAHSDEGSPDQLPADVREWLMPLPAEVVMDVIFPFLFKWAILVEFDPMGVVYVQFVGEGDTKKADIDDENLCLEFYGYFAKDPNRVIQRFPPPGIVFASVDKFRQKSLETLFALGKKIEMPRRLPRTIIGFTLAIFEPCENMEMLRRLPKVVMCRLQRISMYQMSTRFVKLVAEMSCHTITHLTITSHRACDVLKICRLFKLLRKGSTLNINVIGKMDAIQEYMCYRMSLRGILKGVHVRLYYCKIEHGGIARGGRIRPPSARPPSSYPQ